MCPFASSAESEPELGKVNFAPGFVANPGEADVKIVADHVEHIAKLAGKQR